MILGLPHIEGEEITQWHKYQDSGIIAGQYRSLPATQRNFPNLKFICSFKFNMNVIKMIGSYLKHNSEDKVKIGYNSEFLFCKEV